MAAIKIRYSTQETGWAIVESSNYSIGNIPIFSENINIDDVVELGSEGEDGFKVIKDVKKIFYHSKTVFEYSEIPDFYQTQKEFASFGCKVEGFFNPKCADGKFIRGLAAIASNMDKRDIEKILKKYGAKIVNHKKRKNIF